MGEFSTIGVDLAKSVFQVHGADASGAVLFRLTSTRRGTPSPMPTSRMTRSSRWSTSWRMGTRLRSACSGARG